MFYCLTSPLPRPCPMPHTRSSPSGLFYKFEQLRFTASAALVMGGLVQAACEWGIMSRRHELVPALFPLGLSVSTHHREKQLGYKLECWLTLTNALLGLQSQSGHSAVLNRRSSTNAFGRRSSSLSSSSLNGC